MAAQRSPTRIGQVFTPFAMLRGDVAAMSIDNQVGVANYIAPGDSTVGRAMPTVGLEYRYPFINVQPWGTQTIEPIAQVIVRPNEPNIGRLPNEDAQSLVFDDSNLFRVDKFSGWDRVEGGGRANVGVQYTAQFNRGGSINALFGQSYQLFGTNSFATATSPTPASTAASTPRGPTTWRACPISPTGTLHVHDALPLRRNDLRRAPLRGRGARQLRSLVDHPAVRQIRRPAAARLPDAREGILGSGSYKVNANWVTTTAIRYDIDANKFDQTQFGVGYIDDCFILGAELTSPGPPTNGNPAPTTGSCCS